MLRPVRKTQQPPDSCPKPAQCHHRQLQKQHNGADAMLIYIQGCTAHPNQKDQQPTEPQAEQSVMPASEQAGLQRGQAAAEEQPEAAAASPATANSQPSSTSQALTADDDHSVATSAVAAYDMATAGLGCDRSMPGSPTAVGGTATAAGFGSPTTLRPIRTRRASSSDASKRESSTMSVSGGDPGHLAAGQSGLQASGRANSLYSSPIFGLASGRSQAFSPAQDHTAQMPRQGIH